MSVATAEYEERIPCLCSSLLLCHKIECKSKKITVEQRGLGLLTTKKKKMKLCAPFPWLTNRSSASEQNGDFSGKTAKQQLLLLLLLVAVREHRKLYSDWSK